MFENAIGLKQKYRNGERIIGVSMAPNTPPDRFDQIMDGDDYDFVSIDSQHTPLSEERIAAFCDMAAERDKFEFTGSREISATMQTWLGLSPFAVQKKLVT